MRGPAPGEFGLPGTAKDEWFHLFKLVIHTGTRTITYINLYIIFEGGGGGYLTVIINMEKCGGQGDRGPLALTTSVIFLAVGRA